MRWRLLRPRHRSSFRRINDKGPLTSPTFILQLGQVQLDWHVCRSPV